MTFYGPQQQGPYNTKTTMAAKMSQGKGFNFNVQWFCTCYKSLELRILANLRKTIKYTAVAYFFLTFLELNALWKNLAAGSIYRQTSG